MHQEWGPNTIEQTREFIAGCVLGNSLPDRRTLELAAVLNDGSLIGSYRATLSEDGRRRRLATRFNPRYWNKGYATEAAKRLVDYLVRELPRAGDLRDQQAGEYRVHSCPAETRDETGGPLSQERADQGRVARHAGVFSESLMKYAADAKQCESLACAYIPPSSLPRSVFPLLQNPPRRPICTQRRANPCAGS